MSEAAPAKIERSTSELVALVEALIFVAGEPVSTKVLAEVLNEDKSAVQAAAEELAREYSERESGLQVREVAGGWQLTTRTELHEEVRQFLKTRPSAKLSLPSLETLAVIAYKQPVTVPEILEIRGVQSATSIKTLLDKRLIVAKGRKETVGRPMQYGTSKEFLLQFGLKDLSELPSIEDFEDMALSSEQFEVGDEINQFEPAQEESDQLELSTELSDEIEESDNSEGSDRNDNETAA
jgi:segregation and condensation protein B